MKNYLLAIILLLGFSGFVSAQKAPIKFGQINKADLLNNVYAPDTSAPAVCFATMDISAKAGLAPSGYCVLKYSKRKGIHGQIRLSTSTLKLI